MAKNILMICSIVFFSILGFRALASEWHTARGNLARTGQSNYPGVKELKGVRWKFKTNGQINSSAVISDEVVYFGSADKTFYAIDILKGTLIWKFSTDMEINGTAIVIDDVVYFDSGFYQYALDSKTGEEKWRLEIAGGSSSPTVYDGNVFFGAGIWNPERLKHDGFLYCVKGGEEKWKFPTLSGVPSNVSIESDVLYFSDEGYVYALQANTQALLWKFENTTLFPDAPVLMRDRCYVKGTEEGFFTEKHYLYALNSKMGDVVWKAQIPQGVYSSPAVSNNMVFFGSHDGNLYALDEASGQVLWHFKTSEEIGSSPAVVGDTIFFGSFDGNLYAVDSKTGKLRWKFQTGEGIFSSPAVWKGMILFGSKDGFFYCLE